MKFRVRGTIIFINFKNRKYEPLYYDIKNDDEDK